MQKKWRTCGLAALIVLAATGWQSLTGQSTTRSVYAITGAKIYPVSSAVIPTGTVVIRNGLIAAVGADIQIPPEATIIDGTGLTVYPGLIDSFTDVGSPAAPAAGPPAPQQLQTQVSPKNTQEALFQTPQGLNA